MTGSLHEVDRFVGYLQAHARGRLAARTARQIEADLGFNDRKLRALAHQAAEAGILICADNAGYFLPASPEEVEETAGRMESQAKEMLGRVGRIRALAATVFRHAPEQMGLSL